jgi:hypothetical protein
MEQVEANQDDADKISSQGRIKQLQIFNMTRRFREVMNEYNQEFVLHRERCKRAIVCQLELSKYQTGEQCFPENDPISLNFIHFVFR